MSELGSNKGQDENKNAPVFDSSELEAKQKADHFANIEDVEARKKEAERKAKAAEKKAEEEHRSAVRAAARKADKEARGSKGGIWNLLFGGWHKWVFIILLMILVVIFVFFVTKKKQDEEIVVDGKEYYDSMVEKYEKANMDKKAFTELANDFSEKVDSMTNDDEKYSYSFYYAKFVYLYGTSVNDAKVAFRSIQPKENITAEESCEIRSLYMDIYNTSIIEENAPLKEQMEMCDVQNG